MILPDVNVLVYAHREDAVDHTHCRLLRGLRSACYQAYPNES
jgi:predicted nucleic acid-binding protein